jgi:hypothetical protein
VKLEHARAKYYDCTGTASAIGRQLALAGVAVVWIFKDAAPDGHIALKPDLLTALLLFFVALVLDFAHYVVGAAIWGIFSFRNERSFHRE